MNKPKKLYPGASLEASDPLAPNQRFTDGERGFWVGIAMDKDHNVLWRCGHQHPTRWSAENCADWYCADRETGGA